MSDDELIRRIRKLHGIIIRLRGIQGDVQSLDFTQFKSAGTHQWSGHTKTSQYDEQYRQGKLKLSQVEPEIQESIQACQSKMSSFAWEVKDIKKKAIAFSIAMF